MSILLLRKAVYYIVLHSAWACLDGCIQVHTLEMFYSYQSPGTTP